MKKSSLADNPLKVPVNDFGTEHYVNGLIRFIENSDAPITIALQGEWGSGKTSLMNKLEQRLCGEQGKFIGVTVNTWEYSMLASPELTIIKILQKLVGSLAAPSMKERVGRFFDKFSRATMKAGLGMFTSETGVVDDVLDGFGTDRPSELEQLKTVLEESIRTRTQDSGKESVLVFIDDLDRLNPPVAVEILELLKNIFTLDRCIFVLAIDYDVVVKGLKPKFGELTDKNEREFRSFFDKIIQVPFSLPVNNYRPMNFVLDALQRIDFIDGIEREDPRVKEVFTKIVVSSVGKNPRSIKRLINTLSLLDCIRKCNPVKDPFAVTSDAKIITFAIVAMQVCYPKIYQLLASQPDFTQWNPGTALKLNVEMKVAEDEVVEWTEVVNSICEQDAYLRQHRTDIIQLLTLLSQTANHANKGQDQDFATTLKKFLDSSSVTGVSTGSGGQELDRYALIDKLHSNILNRVRAIRSDIDLWCKRNTGNGGFHVRLNKKDTFPVVLTPEQDKNKITCTIKLNTWVPRPDAMADGDLSQLLQNEKYAAAVANFDKVVEEKLKQFWIHPATFEYEGKEFGSFMEELEEGDKLGWLKSSLSFDTRYKIVFEKASNFEGQAVIATLSDLIIAAYDFRRACLELP